MMVVSKSFLATALLESSTVSFCLDITDKELNKVHLDWINGKCLVGLGTDGVPSIIGAVSGLATKMTACAGYYNYTLCCTQVTIKYSKVTKRSPISLIRKKSDTTQNYHFSGEAI
jgi:hypothetical protein